ncbi:MAG: hypothetical protein WC471_04430 [Candidatus Woesearchaeota archaeon]
MTLSEKEELCEIAKDNGFDTVSSYLRWAIMNNLPKDIQEIKNILQKREEKN